GMVEQPPSGSELAIGFLIDLLNHIQHIGNRFSIGGMDPKGPSMVHMESDDLFEIFPPCRSILQQRLWSQEIFKVTGTPCQELPAPFQFIAMVQMDLSIMSHFVVGHPLLKFRIFFPFVLWKKEIRKSNGHLSRVGQELGARIVLWEFMPPSPGIDTTGNAQAVQLPIELFGGVDHFLLR